MKTGSFRHETGVVERGLNGYTGERERKWKLLMRLPLRGSLLKA